MNFLELFSGALAQLRFLIPLIVMLIIAYIFKSRWFKGMFGEYLVNKLLSQLPNPDYTLVKNVTLPTEDGCSGIVDLAT